MGMFREQVTQTAGEWNDEAGTKVYALEMILHTLRKAGPAAITDIAAYQKEINTFEMPNPLLKSHTPLKYVGTAYFGRSGDRRAARGQ